MISSFEYEGHVCYTVSTKVSVRCAMKAGTRKLLNFLFLLLTLGIVLYIGLSGNELDE